MKLKKHQIYQDKKTGGLYRIIKIEKDYETGEVLNIKMQGVNNKALVFDLGLWELTNLYNAF